MNTWILVLVYDDDTMTVICHWHHMPSLEEIREMKETCPEKGKFLICQGVET
jgi:hypothetical protein